MKLVKGQELNDLIEYGVGTMPIIAESLAAEARAWTDEPATEDWVAGEVLPEAFGPEAS